MPRTRKQVDPAKLITTAEVLARYPELSRRTLDRMAARQQVPVYKRRPSRKRYWDPDDLDGLWQAAEQ